ncbi:cyclin-dependent kinase 2-associated protein 2 isoform X3 [Phyllostomus hastatus]|uniref:cyclin-dependent kinase 2-associated protein 2 isoform X3 n=1 Tax=Phyllostomus hastatus TaxID=9423 RepID=UPI001E682CCD|nr:cyclin-dependent kinase 2-associated protein 2 isoform X3 [Phyllostomus hastatus]
MSYKPIAPAPSSTPGSSTPGPGTPVPTGNEAPRRPGLPEHLHGLAVGHRGDGQRDSAHLCWQQERHGAPEERASASPWPSPRVALPVLCPLVGALQEPGGGSHSSRRH